MRGRLSLFTGDFRPLRRREQRRRELSQLCYRIQGGIVQTDSPRCLRWRLHRCGHEQRHDGYRPPRHIPT